VAAQRVERRKLRVDEVQLRAVVGCSTPCLCNMHIAASQSLRLVFGFAIRKERTEINP